jgi:hypothetical protein
VFIRGRFHFSHKSKLFGGYEVDYTSSFSLILKRHIKQIQKHMHEKAGAVAVLVARESWKKELAAEARRFADTSSSQQFLNFSF